MKFNTAFIPSEDPAPKFKPTDEQIDARDKFRSGQSLKVNAYAGTGKTSTLTLLASGSTRHGLYLAFNKAIASDAERKFPRNVRCRTTHSLALSWIFANRKQFDKDRLFGNMNVNRVLDAIQVPRGAYVGGHAIRQRQIASIALRTLRRYQQSDSETIEWFHAPVSGSLEFLNRTCPDEVRKFRGEVAKLASNLWEASLYGQGALGHDGYLKVWSLARPRFNEDFILLDEAQDTNPAVLSVLRNQDAQVVYVGDRYQQIYSWRGAINAMEIADTVHLGRLTQSFRFGEGIASVANIPLQYLGEDVPLRGNGSIESFATEDEFDDANAILCRSNVGVLNEAIMSLDAGERPAIVGGSQDMMRLIRGARSLQDGHPSDAPEYFGYSTWDEVLDDVKDDPTNDLALFCSLVEAFGLEKMANAIGQTVQEPEADVIISTAHKAKGREWRKVRLSGFMQKHGVPNWAPSDEEIRLLYVALTRATHAVCFDKKVSGYLGLSS